MTTIKSYTDLEQSKILSEFLPCESADMEFMFLKRDNSIVSRVPFVKDGTEEPDCPYNMVACWSLAALLSVLPKGTNISTPNPINELSYCCWNHYDEIYADNPVDACYEMILKLYELKML